jgi:hypothetical protein
MNKTSKLLLFAALVTGFAAQSSLFARESEQTTQDDRTIRQQLVDRLEKKKHASAAERIELRKVLDNLQDSDVARVNRIYDMIDKKGSYMGPGTQKINNFKRVLRQINSKSKEQFRAVLERLELMMQERIDEKDELPSIDEATVICHQELTK